MASDFRFHSEVPFLGSLECINDLVQIFRLGSRHSLSTVEYQKDNKSEDQYKYATKGQEKIHLTVDVSHGIDLQFPIGNPLTSQIISILFCFKDFFIRRNRKGHTVEII